jgi:cardiolipin synthase
VAADLEELSRRLESLLGVPGTGGNQVDVLRNGAEIFPAMLDAISGAQRSVDLLTYMYRSGRPPERFAAALAERARAGCRVRVLVDGVGGALMDHALAEEMRQAGVDFHFFRPPWLRSPFAHNHRTHRKVLVVDGSQAFTGGVGISEEWAGDARTPEEWRDTQIRVVGPGVRGLEAAFVQNWAEAAASVDDPRWPYPELPAAGDHTIHVVRGRSTVGWDDIQTAWYALVTAAEERITLQTAYFAPDESFRLVLAGAVRRGVRVQVLVPGPHYDKALSRLASERHYHWLLDDGVEVWRYQPTMLHTKIVTLDDQVAMIGSSNVNRRSLHHDEEAACIIVGGDAPRVLREDFEADCRRAEQVRAEEWSRRGVSQRVAEQAVRPIRRFL